MSRISKILVRVRDSLSDPNGDRWSDDRLLRLLDDAQRDIAIKAKLIRKFRTIPLVQGQALYDLHSEVYALQRVTYGSEVLPLKTRDYMDRHVDSDWETDTGSPEYIIYDKTNLGQIQVYPIPDSSLGGGAYEFTAGLSREWNGADFSSHYGVVADSGTLGDSFSSVFGVTTDIDYLTVTLEDGTFVCDTTTDAELSSVYGLVTDLDDGLYIYYDRSGGLYGVVTDVSDMTLSSEYGVLADIELFTDAEANVFLNGSDPENINGTYGVTTSLDADGAALRYHYLYDTDEVSSVDDTLAIDSVFDIALKYYVVGMALRDDMDTQNRSLAQEYLALYERELQEATRVSERDFTQTTQYKIDYRGLI